MKLQTLLMGVVLLPCLASESRAVEASRVNCRVQYVQLPRAEFNKLMPHVGDVLKPAVLKQLQELIVLRRATVLANLAATTPSGGQGQDRSSVRTMICPPGSGLMREFGAILNVTPTVLADRGVINLRLISEISKPVQNNPNSWSIMTSVVTQSGLTLLLAVHDAITVAQYLAGNDVVLVLLTASLAGVEAQVTTLPGQVTAQVQYLQVPRAEAVKLLPKEGEEVRPEVLRQFQQWIAMRQATILAQPTITTLSGSQTQNRAVVETYYGTKGQQVVREVGEILYITPVIGQDGKTLNVTLVSELSSPAGGGIRDGKLNLNELTVQRNAVLQSGSTVLLAVKDAIPDDPRFPVLAANKMVLVLLTATSNPRQ